MNNNNNNNNIIKKIEREGIRRVNNKIVVVLVLGTANTTTTFFYRFLKYSTIRIYFHLFLTFVSVLRFMRGKITCFALLPLIMPHFHRAGVWTLHVTYVHFKIPPTKPGKKINNNNNNKPKNNLCSS